MALTNFGALTSEQLTLWSPRYVDGRPERDVHQSVPGQRRTIDDSARHRAQEEHQRRACSHHPGCRPSKGTAWAGDRTLKGNEEAGKAYDQVIRVDQLRHANKSEGRMAEQKSVVAFRETSKNILGYWHADRWDQMAFLTLSGVTYASKNNGASRVGSDLPNLEFAADVTAPSTNRHRRWVASSASLASGATASVAATDLPSWKMLVEMKAYAEDNYIRPIRGEGGTALYNVFMTPRGIAKLKLDSDFMLNWRTAQERSKDNPLFKGADVLYVDGLAIYSYRHVYNTTGLGSGSKWGGAGTVEGVSIP